MERQRSTGTRARTPAQTTTRRGLALGLAAAPLAVLAGASAAAAAMPAPAAEVAAWGDLLARYVEALRVRDAAEKEHTRLEDRAQAVIAEADSEADIAAALETAKAELAMSNAGTRRDALMLQLMATPAPHAEALRFKAEQINGEDAEYFTYALDGLLEVFTADALFFAGVGPRASREVLDEWLEGRAEWIADNDETAADRLTVAEAKARKIRREAAQCATLEAKLGKWLDAVERGAGRLEAQAASMQVQWVTMESARAVLGAKLAAKIERSRAHAIDTIAAAHAFGPFPESAATVRPWRVHAAVYEARLEDLSDRFCAGLKAERFSTIELGKAVAHA